MQSLTRKLAAAAVLLAASVGPGAVLAKEKPVMDLELARKVADAAAAEAKRLSAGGAIAVVDDGGHLVYLVRLDGTFPAAASVSIGKARTAATFQRPTSVFEDAIKNGRISLTAVSEMVPLQGGIPISVGGQVVGAVGVSGAASAQQDEEIAKVAAAAAADMQVGGRQ